MSTDNPYRMYRDFDLPRDEWSGDPVEESAPGLDGQTLHGLLQRAFADGHRRGRGEARQTAHDEKVAAWDEGRSAGIGDARHEARREFWHRLRTAADHLEWFGDKPKTTIAKDRERIGELAKRVRDITESFHEWTQA